MASPKKKRLPARLYSTLVHDVKRDQRLALAECIEVGMPAMVERYGHHSMEVRGLEDLKEKLSNTK